MTQPELDFTPGSHHRSLTGSALRDRGLARVVRDEDDEAWITDACHMLAAFARASEFVTIESIRPNVRKPRIGNLWGVVARRAVADRIIRATDRFIKSTHPAAHARRTMVWKSLVWNGSNDAPAPPAQAT